MRLGDLADDSAPHELAQASITVVAMPLVAHLRGDLVLVRHFAELAGLGDVVAERFLAVDALAQLHGDHRRGGMMVVGRGDEHGVDLLVQLVEHAAVIVEGLDLAVAALAAERLLETFKLLVVHVDQGHEMFAGRSAK